ncbi:glycosyltransferase family 4 protein [Kordiimonas gwangyangensis]|uniref:glycosyltransferase family 4 protein n=1 Tax=Kordiimonas gwangyangensis TaxID=288022 RepID=UPI00037E8140|nr:glycosyltransferase family 4 protein [Kordiimonas gwangyangensis]
MEKRVSVQEHMVAPRPRILHVFPSFEVGGAQRRLVSIINRRQGHFTHSVFAMNGCYDALKLVRDISVPKDDLPSFPKKSGLAAMRECAHLLDEYAPDLLVTYNWGSVEWDLSSLLGKRCKTVHVQDGFGPDEVGREKFHRRITRAFAYRRADAVVVPSRTLETIASKSWRVRTDRLHYIPNGIDVDRFICPPDPKVLAEFELEPTDRIIGTVAALRPEKNIGKLIEAFAQIADLYPTTKLVIVGDGIGMKPLKMLAERIGLYERVVFTGNMAHPESIVPAFELFALSSDTEQMPISVIEAMAAGLPVVSTDVGDVAGMVSRQNAAYVQENSAGALARNLSALLDKPEAAKRIGAANQAKAKRDYSLEGMIDRYDGLFMQLLGRAL